MFLLAKRLYCINNNEEMQHFTYIPDEWKQFRNTNIYFSKKYDFYYDIDLNTIVKPNIYGEIKIYNPSSQKYTIILFIKALWITFNGEINSTDYVYYKNKKKKQNFYSNIDLFNYTCLVRYI